jgi:hypothetical protein
MALLENIQNFFRDTLSVIAAKNADYARPEATGDEYFNFVGTAFIHRVSPQTVIAMEITKKAIRLANLADGTSPTTGEAVSDTLRDIIGYAAIYQSFEADEKADAVSPDPNPTPDDIDVHPANENTEVNETPQSLSAEVKSALLRLLSR